MKQTGYDRKLNPRNHPELYVEALIRRRAGIPLSQEQSAILLGVSRSRVHQVEQTAIAKLRAVAKRSEVFA